MKKIFLICFIILCAIFSIACSGNKLPEWVQEEIDFAYEDGYNDGYKDGYSDGYDFGYDDGEKGMYDKDAH